MPNKTNQSLFTLLQNLNLDPLLRCQIHSSAHPRPVTCQACRYNQPSPLPPSPTNSMSDLANDMIEWFEGVDLSEEFGSDEEGDSFTSESIRVSESEG